MKHAPLPFRLFPVLLLALFAYGQAPTPPQSARGEDAPRLVVQLGNVGGIGLVALSKDNRLALTAEDNATTGEDHSLCLWRPPRGARR